MARRFNNSQLYRILAVGRDISSLSSRANLLTQAGYTADIFLNMDQAVGRALVRRYDLAIVSSTFTSDEQTAIRSRLKQVRPNLPVLLLEGKHDSSDAFLSAVEDCLKPGFRFRYGIVPDQLPAEHRIK